MSYPNRQRSPKFRYWKAKVEPLLRPAFWLSGTFLCLSVLLVWKYYSDSNWKNIFLQLINSSVASEKATEKITQADQDQLTESVDELDLGTEIDNSFLFLRELNSRNSNKKIKANQELEIKVPNTDDVLQQTLPQLPPQANNQSGLVREGTYGDILEDSGLGIFSSNFPFNSGVSDNYNLTNTNTRSQSLVTPHRQNSSIYYRFNEPSSNQTSLPIHPLQQSLNRLNTVNKSPETDGEQTKEPQSSPEVQAQVREQTNPLLLQPATQSVNQPSQPLLGTGSTVQTTPVIPNQNSFTYLNQPQFNNTLPLTVPVVPYAPGTFASPVPGTTIPQITNSRGNNQSSNQFNNTNVPRLITHPGFNHNFRSPALQPLPTNTTINNQPRRIPGRFIGGGEINTFSNP